VFISATHTDLKRMNRDMRTGHGYDTDMNTRHEKQKFLKMKNTRTLLHDTGICI